MKLQIAPSYLEGLSIHRLAPMNVDGAAHNAIQTGFEETRRIWQRRCRLTRLRIRLFIGACPRSRHDCQEQKHGEQDQVHSALQHGRAPPGQGHGRNHQGQHEQDHLLGR